MWDTNKRCYKKLIKDSKWSGNHVYTSFAVESMLNPLLFCLERVRIMTKISNFLVQDIQKKEQIQEEFVLYVQRKS